MKREHAPLPRLYAILDAEVAQRHHADLIAAARTLFDAGVLWLQYRDKVHDDATVLRNAQAIRATCVHPSARLILNDRVHLVTASGFHGVHLGQEDMAPETARERLTRDAIIGLSTHTLEQAFAGEKAAAVDYVAFGPVFETGSKVNPEMCVGLGGLRSVRQLVSKPLVAIGGISAESAGEVLNAGADSIAVIGALFATDGNIAEAARDLMRSVAPEQVSR